MDEGAVSCTDVCLVEWFVDQDLGTDDVGLDAKSHKSVSKKQDCQNKNEREDDQQSGPFFIFVVHYDLPM